jgi:hypothetical protein
MACPLHATQLRVEDGVTRITTEYHGDHAVIKSLSAVECAFLADPDTAYDALQLAVLLHKQKHDAPPAQLAQR